MTFPPRAHINMSEFINNLNTVIPESEISTGDLGFSFENELFLPGETNPWFDFDQGTTTDLQATAPFEFDASRNTTTIGQDSGNLLKGTDFNFQGFEGLPSQQPQAPYQNPVSYQASPVNYSSPLTAGAPATGPRTGDKRNASIANIDSPHPGPYENDESRQAAEEDKRRRNTAASARFRVKKKQKEQALEKSAKEMQEKMSSLENKISQLETENKWLKSLVIEKKDTKSAEEIAEMYRKFREETDSKEGKASEVVI